MDWLKKNSDRAKERTEWTCIEIYGDCFLEPIASTNPNPFNQPLNCVLLYQECWTDSPRGSISGSVNWAPTVNPPNTTDPNTTDPNNSDGGSNSTPDINEDFYAEKAAFLEKWLEDNSLDNELFDELYLCVYHMYVEGYGLVEPTGIAPGCVEEAMLPSVLMERFGWDANHPNVIFLASNPSYLNFILEADEEFITEFTNLMLKNSDNENLTAAARTAINLQIHGVDNQNQEYLNILSEEAIEGINPIILQYFISREIAILKLENPDWQNEGNMFMSAEEKIHYKAVLNVFLDGLHLGLDIVGLVPAVGEVADLVNGAIYTLEGDGVNATLSFAAVIPFAGWTATGAKYARKVKQLTGTGTTAHLRWAVDALGRVHFGYRGQLRTIMKPLINQKTHHILPWQFNSHPLIQKAAKANKNGSAYHPSDPFNGINISDVRHSAPHLNYSNRIRQFLDQLDPNMSNNDAFFQVETFMLNLRNVIINNPNTPINNLIF